MYMDLSLFGISGAENLDPVSVVTYDSSKGWTYESIKCFMENTSNNSTTKKYSYQISANGLVVKPASFTGTRRACGKLQDAYTEYLLAWIDWKNAYDAYKGKYDRLSVTIEKIDSLLGANKTAYEKADTRHTSVEATTGVLMALHFLKSSFDIGEALAENCDAYASNIADLGLVGMGLTAIFNPALAIYAAAGGAGVAAKGLFKSFSAMTEGMMAEVEAAQTLVDNAATWASDKASWNDAQKSAFDEAREAVSDLGAAARDINATWAKMVAAAENFDTIVAEGDRIQQERATVRAKSVNRIIELRYNDMFFRQVQDESLTRYTQAFDLRDRSALGGQELRRQVPRRDRRRAFARQVHGRRRPAPRHVVEGRSGPCGHSLPHDGELLRPQGAPRNQQPGPQRHLVLAPEGAVPHRRRCGRRRRLAARALEVHRGRHPHGA